MNYIQLFRTLDSVRNKFHVNIVEILKTVPGLPKVIIYLIICFVFFNLLKFDRIG